MSHLLYIFPGYKLTFQVEQHNVLHSWAKIRMDKRPSLVCIIDEEKEVFKIKINTWFFSVDVSGEPPMPTMSLEKLLTSFISESFWPLQLCLSSSSPISPLDPGSSCWHCCCCCCCSCGCFVLASASGGSLRPSLLQVLIFTWKINVANFSLQQIADNRYRSLSCKTFYGRN